MKAYHTKPEHPQAVFHMRAQKTLQSDEEGTVRGAQNCGELRDDCPLQTSANEKRYCHNWGIAIVQFNTGRQQHKTNKIELDAVISEDKVRVATRGVPAPTENQKEG